MYFILQIVQYFHVRALILYTREALLKAKDKIAEFAHREGLDAHARSVLVRFEEEV